MQNMRNSNPIRARRSVHFVPAPNEKMLEKSTQSAADTVVIDLEDAVTPTKKVEAQKIVADWLRDVDFGSKEVAKRLNPIDTPWGLADLEATMVNPPHIYMVPKAERLTTLQTLDTLIGKYEMSRTVEQPPVGLMLIGNETPLGVANLGVLAGEPRVVALTWGAEDLAASIGAATNRDVHGAYLGIFAQCRNQTVLVAKTFGIQALDTVFVRLNDEYGLREDCKITCQMGFTGKFTIHPDQISLVNEAFTPTSAAITRARQLVEAFAEVRREGRNAFRFEGQMVDSPHIFRTEELLSRARQLGES